MNTTPRIYPVYTDQELVDALRQRAEWKSVAGSETFRRLLQIAADRIEQQMQTREHEGPRAEAMIYRADRLRRVQQMTKTEAHRRIDAGTVTWGYLKTLLRSEMGAPPHRSVVNPTMSHEHAIDVLSRAIDTRDDDEVVGSKWGTERRDRLIATNVLRECAASVGVSR